MIGYADSFIQKDKRQHPFLRWAGSKKKLIPQLMQYWSGSYERYIEPFAGSACLFFAISPKAGILGDLNKELINTFREVRNNPVKVSLALNSLKSNKSVFDQLRAIDPLTIPCHKRAVRFIYLNRNCFSGLYRTNEKGIFNVPFANSKTGNMPTENELVSCSKALKKAKLVAGDFEECLCDIRKGDFVYLDPPYAVSSRRVFREYGPKIFGIPDLERLQKAIQRIHDIGAHFVVSYAYSSEGIKCLKKWSYRKVRTIRNISGFTGSQKFAYEILATNISEEDRE